MNEPTRRAWSRPELIVIVRSGSEEAALLMNCKGGASAPSAMAGVGQCVLQVGFPCAAMCSQYTA